MPGMWIAGASLASGLLGADAASSAADAQSAAAQQATAQQRAMFDKTVELNAPFRTSGVNAMSKLNGLLGIGGTPGGAGSGLTYDQLRTQLLPQFTKTPDQHWVDDNQNGNGWWASGGTPTVDESGLSAAIQAKLGQQGASPGVDSNAADYGSLLKPFGMQDFHLDPGIQFQMQQGNQALMNSAAAKNGVLSGGALKDFIGYNQGMAGTGYQSAFDRYMANKSFTLGSLMDMTKLGQASANNTVNNAGTFSNGIAGSIQGAGNAQAAGSIGTANALSSGLGGAANGYYLNSLLKNNGSTDMGGPITTQANPNGVYLAPTA